MEVRKANNDCTTSYERQMPGAARMYPETDIPLIRITQEQVDLIEIPEMIEDKIPRYEKMGLGKDLAVITAKSPKAGLFETFVSAYKKIKPAYIAEIIMSADKNIKRQYGIDINPKQTDYDVLFKALENEEISKESVEAILKENRPVAEVISKYKTMSDTELEQEIREIIDENKGLQFNALIGEVMKKLRGKAPGQKINEMLKKMVQ